MSDRAAAIVLATGSGAAMKSALPPALHPLCGQPLARYAVQSAAAATAGKPVVVAGEQMRAALGDIADCVVQGDASQSERRGLPDALLQARHLLARKNSTLGPGAKMGHFSYLGDATIGAHVNIGCGTITCNFDGEHKHPTVVDDDAFIGSDTMLVAPLHIGQGAKTGAGSVVTRDIPAHAVAYGVPARVKRTLGDTGQARAEE